MWQLKPVIEYLSLLQFFLIQSRYQAFCDLQDIVFLAISAVKPGVGNKLAIF